jgi:hypothetical protein
MEGIVLLMLKFRQFVTCKIIQNKVQLHTDAGEDYIEYMGRNGVYGDNVEVIAISEVFKVGVIVYFVSEGQVPSPLTFYTHS